MAYFGSVALGQHDVECNAIRPGDSARLVSLTGRVLGEQDMTRAESQCSPSLQFNLAFAGQCHDELPARRGVPVERVSRCGSSELQAGDRPG